MNVSIHKFAIFAFVLGFVILCGFLCCDNRENHSLRDKVRELELLLATGANKVDTFYVHDSIPVWKERVIEVERSDYKELLADRELIKELKLRIAQVEAENRLLLSNRDTVYLHEELSDSVQVLRYRDSWVDFSYFERDKKLEYSVRDSLTTIVSREYKHHFLWWRWGTKGYNVYIMSHNPHAKVEYNQYIKVK